MSYLCHDQTVVSWKKSIPILRIKPVSGSIRNTVIIIWKSTRTKTIITANMSTPVLAMKSTLPMTRTATVNMTTTTSTSVTAMRNTTITTTGITITMAAGSIGLPK